jgi:hypothetical protein
MQPHPPFDRELLIPIATGLVAILGLGWIFLTNYRSESPVSPTVEPTAIPFNVSPPKTGTLHPLPSATPPPEEILSTATGAGPDSYPGPPAQTLPPASTLITKSPPSPSVTPTPDQPLPAGKFDDTDPRIDYDRFWTFEMNSGTAYAYKGTLHISTGIGNKVSFYCTGQRFHLGYQRGKNFGVVTVLIDDQSYTFHEQAFGNIWRSPQLSSGTHSVILIHESGESINLDYVEIIG